MRDTIQQLIRGLGQLPELFFYLLKAACAAFALYFIGAFLWRSFEFLSSNSGLFGSPWH